MVLGKGRAPAQNHRHPKLGPPGTQKQYGQEWKIEGRLGRKTAFSKPMIKIKRKKEKKTNKTKAYTEIKSAAGHTHFQLLEQKPMVSKN